MADLDIEVEVNADQGERWKRIIEEGGQDAVDQLAVLSERHMKDEAPEGVGIPNVNMATTIKPSLESTDPYRKSVAPRKKTEEGWPLHHAIIEGTDYDDAPPPLDPILRWAKAKITPDEGSTFLEAAQAIRWNIFHDGHETFPNPFITRSLKRWEGRAEQIARDAVDDAFDSGGGI